MIRLGLGMVLAVALAAVVFVRQAGVTPIQTEYRLEFTDMRGSRHYFRLTVLRDFPVISSCDCVVLSSPSRENGRYVIRGYIDCTNIHAFVEPGVILGTPGRNDRFVRIACR